MESVAAVAQFHYIALLYAVALADIILGTAPCGILSEHDALIGNAVEVVDAGLYLGILWVTQFLVVGCKPETKVAVGGILAHTVGEAHQQFRVSVLCICTGT